MSRVTEALFICTMRTIDTSLILTFLATPIFAQPFPMPEVPPVIKAVLPVSLFMDVVPSVLPRAGGLRVVERSTDIYTDRYTIYRPVQ